MRFHFIELMDWDDIEDMVKMGRTPSAWLPNDIQADASVAAAK